MYLSVIIPMYNEAANVERCIRTLVDTLEAAELSGGYELLLLDDGSIDPSPEIAERVARETSNSNGVVRVLRSSSGKNEGKGAAVRRGMLAAHGELRIFTDCDLAYGADVIVRMAERMNADTAADTDVAVLIGSRAIASDGYSGYTPIRRLASRAFVRLLALTAGFHYTDSQCGIKLFRAEAAQEIFSRAEVNGWAFDFELLLLADALGYTVAEHPVTVLNHGESKIHLLRDSLRMLSDVRRIRRRIA